MFSVFCKLLTAVAIMLATVANGWTQNRDGPSDYPWQSPPRFTEALDKIARQQRLNVIAQYFTFVDTEISSRRTALRTVQTIDEVASMYGCNLARVGSILVLYTPVALNTDRYFEETRVLNVFGDLAWKDGVLEFRPKKGEDGTVKLTVSASDIPLKRLCQQFEAQTGWKVVLGTEVQDTRIFARLQSVSPGELVEAISVLLGAQVEVKMTLSEETRDKHRRMIEQSAQSDLFARDKKSDELLPELLALLTPEEMERFKRGEMVDIPLSRLPTEVQDKALHYVNFVIDRSSLRPEESLFRYRDRLRELEVILHLPSVIEGRWFAPNIGITVRDPEGVLNHF